MAWNGDAELATSGASDDPLVKIWNTSTGDCSIALDGHSMVGVYRN